MTARFVAGVLALACLMLVGCSTKEGQRVAEYERGGRLQEKKVSAAGRYTLHSTGRPDVTFRVAKGERVGFRRGREGRVEAYAGDNPPVELDRGAANGAYWQFDRKAGQ
jgi:hypothetical protein